MHRTISEKTSSTLCRRAADVSKNGQLNSFAMASPSLVDTCRLSQVGGEGQYTGWHGSTHALRLVGGRVSTLDGWWGWWDSPLPEVTLVACYDDGDWLVVPDSVDHLLEAVELVMTALLCDGVDENEAFSSSHVLLPHGRELILHTHSIQSGDKIYGNTCQLSRKTLIRFHTDCLE